jgi:hypothetical protein
MTIDGSQNVGIGTASPSYKLSLSGTATTYASSASVGFYDTTSTAGARNWLIGNVAAGSYGELNFAVSSAAGGAPTNTKMTLDSSGNLLVGTTSQAYSGKQVTAFSGATHNGLALNETANTSGTTYIGFLNGGTAIGSVGRVGATAAVIYNTTSDQRLKSNIEPAAPVLDKLMQVQVRQYDWTEGDLHQDYGFIAQELEPVLSGVVTKGKTEEDMWQMDYSRLTPHLVKAIQEQQAIITQLQADVAALKGAA